MASEGAIWAPLVGAALWSWVGLFGLGAFHGLNPGMGWLFAVARGLQEGERREVWRALLPLGVGHALAIAAVLLVAVSLGVAVPAASLRWPVAALLVGFGAFRLVRHRHPRWASMRVGMAGLTWWSFLMASAHGAGLMVAPVFMSLTASTVTSEQHLHQLHAATISGTAAGTLATVVHGAGYLLVTALIAVVVFEKLGLGLLRRAWLNLDLVWVAALMTTGVLTVVVPM